MNGQTEAANGRSSSPCEGSSSSGGDGDGQLTYSWRDVNVYVTRKEKTSVRLTKLACRSSEKPQERRILNNVNGVCRPGELLAVMGASGAGKTTLLNVLTHRNNDKVRVTGDLHVNGRPVHPDSLTSLSAYVQQDDLFIGLLTVREQLIFQAMLRMDRDITLEQRVMRVEEVIMELGLTKCAFTKIGVPGRIKGISGGEMKRLAFACEVLTNPPLMFCDEPTSGLDSFMAQAVVGVMKMMAERGKTIIATIHQPSSEVYAMFDRVLLMAEGRVAFLGDADAAYLFFSRVGLPCPPNYNPADFFISTLAIQPGKDEACRAAIATLCDEFASSHDGQMVAQAIEDNMVADESGFPYSPLEEARVRRSPYRARWLTQFRWVMWRSWLEVTREPTLIKVRFFQVFLIAVLLGIIYFQQTPSQDSVTNINGAIFLLLTNMTFQNVFGVINTFCVQVPVFLREHLNGMYRTDVYFLAKTLAELPFYIALPFMFSIIAYYMVGFGGNIVNFFTCAAIVVLVANISTSFGYMISCVSRNLNMALALAVPLVIPLMLFGGFFLNNGSTPDWLAWVRYASWFSYGNEALLINQWRSVESIPASGNRTRFPNGEAVLRFLNYQDGSIGVDVCCLCLLLILYRTLAFLGLLSKTFRR
ncbi:protein white [Hyalella azteca]|uniref:Protein white n=1 Tax=Hyalella azteca TaxID=294128 RepID=A0A8B7P535_HYAAZ|nr:protein white [Hyalella azteca]